MDWRHAKLARSLSQNTTCNLVARINDILHVTASWDAGQDGLSQTALSMGIPRLTQDLSPYLESAVISSRRQNEAQVVLDTLVIDGPSMVYHVYNRLTSHQRDNFYGSVSSICCLPSYQDLNSAIDQFLTDLEGCEAKM